jgi:hypothetical protein
MVRRTHFRHVAKAPKPYCKSSSQQGRDLPGLDDHLGCHVGERTLGSDHQRSALPATGRIWGAFTKFNVSASFAEKAYAFWEPIFKRAGPHVQMLTRISDPEM